MDGVLWRGTAALPGVAEFFSMLRELRVPFVLATNNSGKSRLEYVERLRRAGVPDVPPDDVITSGVVTVAYLTANHRPGAPVHVVGSRALKELVTSAGFELSDQAAVVVVGLDLQLTYDKLTRAANLISAGAEYIGTNGDPSLPTATGSAPGTGSIIALLNAATGRKARLMGKPEEHMFRAALRRLGTDPARTLMIGDRFDTDVLGAKRLGMRAALVLTGVTAPESITGAVTADVQVVSGLPELQRQWGTATSSGQA